MLGHRPEGRSAVSNVLPACIRCPVFTQTEVNTEHVLSVTRSSFSRQMRRQMTASDVSISQLPWSQHPSIAEGGEQVESFSRFKQMVGCNFKSPTVIL